MVGVGAPTTTGIILAGGRSSRYGTDKSFAPWNRKPFVARVADAMHPHVDRTIVASRHGIDPDAYAALVPDALVVPDPVPFPGPVDALRRALANEAADRVVVAGCDSPALTPKIVGRLLAATTTGADVAVLILDDRPIHSVFAGRTRPIRARCMTDRLRNVTSDATRVCVSGDGFNVNSPIRR